MNLKSFRKYIPLVFSLIAIVAQAQDTIGTEVINVVKPYTPSVSDAFKINENPTIIDSLDIEKKEVNYSIFSVPVASTFTPAKGKATTIERKRPEKIFGSYATLGFGNYTSVLGELYTNFEVNRGQNLSLFLKHNSSQGGIKEVLLDDKFYNTALDLNFTADSRFMNYELGFGVLHQLYNWYGLSTDFPLLAPMADNIGVDHSYFGASVSAGLAMQDSPFSGGNANLSYFGDSFNSSEIRFVATPEFQFDLGGQDIGTDVEINYLNGTFDRNYQNTVSELKYSYLFAGLQPYIRFQNETFSLKLGAKAVYAMDLENTENDFYIYPKVNASVKVVEEYMTVYAGVDGNLEQNSYFNFTQENPFVSPTLLIAPTDKQYDAFAGINGKISSVISYNLKASYKNEIKKPFFLSNPLAFTPMEGYEFGNSFGLVYDDVTTLKVFGELITDISSGVSIGLNASYFNYSMEFLPEAYNLPELKATLFANAAFTEKLHANFSLFYVGERETEFKTLDAYVDANLRLSYAINDQLSIFAKGSNLFGDSYEKWLNTPVQGIQALAGATYKFDW